MATTTKTPKVPVAKAAPALAQPDTAKVYGWNVMSNCPSPDVVFEHKSKHDYLTLLVARTAENDWVGGYLCRTAMGTFASPVSLKSVRFATSDGAAQWAAGQALANPSAQKLTPNATRILESLAALVPVAEHPVIEQEPDLPWLDCDGNVLLEGDKATVLPDVSERLSGKLVKVLGGYDPQKKSVQVEPVGWEGNDFGILLCFLKRLPVLGENLEERITSGITSMGSPSPELAAKFKAATGRRQEPVAPFAVAGQAEHEATTVPVAKPAPKASAINLTLMGEALDSHKAGLRLVPLASIVVTTNTRKVFDETALAELAESVKAHGILQPIVLRPHASESGKYELVAGGRRYRAAQLAELAEVPATVRNLTDREFLEVQLLENLQRVDVRPADEAEVFAKLLASGYSAEEIGLKVGKGVKFIAQRAKLATLMPFWFDALQEERLPLVAATEIARLPDESQSRLEEVAMRDYSLKQPGAIFKADWIKGTIKSYVLRELNAAAFPKHDAKLYAVAGACTTCPKRSGAVKQLFDEEELKHDYCLDGACFQHKKEAFVEQQCATLKQSTGKPAVRISTDYYQVPKGTLDCYSYKEAKEGAPGAVQAVLVNGSEMGQLKWVVVRANPGAGKSEADKEADAKRLRTERLTKTHRALIAEKLTTDLPQALATQGPVYESVLTYLLLEECSSAKETLAYLRESWGWAPGEAALKDDYNDKDARGFRPWKRFVLEMVGPLSLEQKLEMYLALKVRHRMHYDYEDRQFTIAKLVAGHGYPELAAEAEQAVELRYYTRKGKKQEVPA